MASNEPTTTHLDSERGDDNTGSTTYKRQLDRAAKDANAEPEAKPGDARHPIVETVAQYVPAAVGKLLGAGSKGGDDETKKLAPAPGPDGMPGPPERPAHDTQIEEFVRDQHRSKTDALLEDKVQ